MTVYEKHHYFGGRNVIPQDGINYQILYNNNFVDRFQSNLWLKNTEIKFIGYMGNFPITSDRMILI